MPELQQEALHIDHPPQDMVALIESLWQDSKKANQKRFTRQQEELAFALKHQHYLYENVQSKDQRLLQPHSVQLFHMLRHKWSEIVKVPTYIECRPQLPGFDDPMLAEDAKIALESVLTDSLRGYSRLRRRWVMGALAARSWVMAFDYDWELGDVVFRLVEPWRFHVAPGWADMHDLSCPWVGEDATLRLNDVRGMLGWENLALVHPDSARASDQAQQARGSTLKQLGQGDEQEKSEQDTVTILKWWFKKDDRKEPQPGLPQGRLVIVAPYSKQVLYDDAWICPLRSFPYMELRCYEQPVERVGLSDTALQWDNVLLLNMTKRFGWEQLRRSPGLYSFPAEGLLNAQRQPFTYSDLHGQIAYWTNPQAARGIQHFPGSGINPSMFQFHALIADDFRSSSGIADIGLTAQQSKDIPVGTVRQLVEQGEVPVRDHIAILQEEESVGFGVLLDLLVHTWGPERAVRYLGPDGQFRIKLLQQASLTSMEVIVTAAPTLGAIKQDEMQQALFWANIMRTDPAAAMSVAEWLNIPSSFVQRYIQRLQQLAPPALPLPGGPGPEIPSAIAARLSGVSGNGGPYG